MTPLSRHFSLEELTRSDWAIRNGVDNTAPEWVRINLLLLCERILEPIRDMFGAPVLIHSGYRSPIVNRAIGGAERSEHLQGKAADFEVTGVSNEAVMYHLHGTNLHIGQCILEFPPDGWIHVSYDPQAKRQFLVATKNKANGSTLYTPYLVVN